MLDKIMSLMPKPLVWLRSVWLQGGPSISRITTFMACSTLCYATIKLSSSVPADSMALGVVVTGLTGLVGYAYGRGRTSEERLNGDAGDGKDA